jgi:hypothetical protein
MNLLDCVAPSCDSGNLGNVTPGHERFVIVNFFVFFIRLCCVLFLVCCYLLLFCLYSLLKLVFDWFFPYLSNLNV